MHWFIDTIDVRAGTAFASQRTDDLRAAQMLDTPSAFIAAPYFEPEFIDGRALGFSLGRHRAQYGFFIAKEEVPFPSLAAVAEFVRRAYLRGSSGNGPGEDGVPPPTGPEGGEGGASTPELPGLEEHDRDPVNQLVALASDCDLESGSLYVGQCCSFQTVESGTSESAEIKGERLRPFGLDGKAVVNRLVRAALRLLIEAGGRAADLSDPEREAAWHQSFVRLADAICQLGLISPLERMLAEYPYLLDQILQGTSPPHLDRFLDVVRHGYPYPGYCHFGYPSADPYEDLCRILVPADVSQGLGGRTTNPSLRAQLAAVLATPLDRLDGEARRLGQARAELAFFAACYLNLGSDRARPYDWDPDPTGFIGPVAKRALTWMGRNLPQILFAGKVEQHIARADQIATGTSGRAASA